MDLFNILLEIWGFGAIVYFIGFLAVNHVCNKYLGEDDIIVRILLSIIWPLHALYFIMVFYFKKILCGGK